MTTRRAMTDAAEVLASLRQREARCWDMVQVFLENRDAHGVMDMGAELQSLRIAIQTVERMVAGE